MFVSVPPKPDDDAGTPPDAAPVVPPEVVRDLRAFVGRNADYYLRAWWPALAGRPAFSINRFAFVFAWVWLPYRRMYRAAALFYGAWITLDVLTAVTRVFAGVPRSPLVVDFAFGLTAAAVCGVWGNRWYLNLARREVADVQARGLPDAERRAALAARGGTDPLGAIGVAVAGVLAMVLVEAALVVALWAAGLTAAPE